MSTGKSTITKRTMLWSGIAAPGADVAITRVVTEKSAKGRPRRRYATTVSAIATASGLVLPVREDRLDRERYLFYVCASRAERLLVLSSRSSDEEGNPQTESYFVDDMRALLEDGAELRTRSLSDVTWRPEDAPTSAEWDRAHAATGPRRPVPQPPPLSAEPLLAELSASDAVAARALEKSLSLVPEKDGAMVGGLREPRSGLECAVRIHTPTPGIFAFDAWSLPPERGVFAPALIERVDAFNTSLEAGALLLFLDGFVIYRWACPYRWLDAAQLSTPVVAHVALEAFMRWRTPR